jgi:hypothetical protein
MDHAALMTSLQDISDNLKIEIWIPTKKEKPQLEIIFFELFP